jgi:calcineurin-like phosphoesterase family protein
MSTTWFTSDIHFGHTNIIKYTNRPFKNINHMNVELIKSWNERVKKEDTIFFLGDFCFGDSNDYKKKLQGNIIFICGNHDYTNKLNTHITGIAIEFGGKEIWLTHNPENYNPEYSINFVGHIHALWKFHKKEDGTILVNVGVDVWNYKPINFREIMKELNKWEGLE